MAKFNQTLRGQVITRVTVVLIALLLVLGVSQYVLLGRYMVNKAADTISQQIRSGPKSSPGGGLNLQELAHSMGGQGSSILLLDSEGNVLASTGPYTEWMRQKVADLPILDFDKGPRRGLGSPRSGQSITGSVDGESLLMVVDRVPNGPLGPLTIAIARSTADITSYLNFMALMTALASLIGLLLVMLILWLLLGRSLQPIGQLADAAVAIAEGDWSQRVTSCGSHEVDQAAYAFNRMIERLDEAFKIERQQHERMQRFIADAAHELRTPLTALNGFIELMRSGAASSPPNQGRALTAMNDESQRMTRLVTNLLQIARMDANHSMPLTPLDLGEMLQQLVPTLQAADPKKPVQLHIDGTNRVLGNSDALKQVLWNLVDNARRYSPDERPVVIDCHAKDKKISLSITDQGIGIAEQDIPHLFDRFWRGDTSRTRASGGTGLGLSIVQSIVQAHGGTIEVHSQLGQGTTFEILFPDRTQTEQG